MNKLLTKIVGAALGAAMAIGVGVAVVNSSKDIAMVKADSSAVITWSSFGINGTAAAKSETTSGYNVAISSVSTQGVVKNGTINNTVAFPGSITSLTVNGAKTGSAKTDGTFAVYGGTSSSAITTKIDDVSGLSSTASNPGVTFTGNYTFFKIVVGSARTLIFTNITVSYSTGGGVTSHDLTYAVGTQGVYDGSTTKTFSVAESGTHTVKTPAQVGITANTGYVFSAWNDGTNNYAPSSTYTMGTSNVTLTAQWVAGIALSYNKNNNSATGSTATTYVASGETQTVAACGFSLSGYAFSHWNTESDDSGVSYDPTDTITNFTSALTLYAIWEDLPEFELVTDATQLTAGTKAIFVASGTYSNTTYTNAMVTERTTANSSSTVTNATLSDGFNAGSVATADGATIYTLGGTSGAWTIKNGDNQLAFTGTGNNNMKFNEEMTDTFAITSSGNNVDVTSNTYNTRALRYNVNQGSPRFSNYASGAQTAIYMFASIAEATFGTVHHIKISHSPNILSWHDGSTFSDAGLIVVAFDGADENTANSRLLDASEYTSSVANGTVFNDSDIGSKTITITYNENTLLTDTYSVYVYAAATYELVETTPTSWAGNYLIVATIETGTESIDAGTYAFMSDLSDHDVPTNAIEVSVNDKQITTGQEMEWSFASITGGYSIQGKSGKYVGWTNSSKNGMDSSNSAYVNVISNSGSTVQIANTATTTRYLSLSSASGQFRYYTSGSVELYKLVESDDVSDYADMFLETLSTGASAVCQYNESTHVVSTDLDDLKQAWKDLADLFDLLSNPDKQQFTQGTADESGSNVEQALALYDFVASKYNDSLEGEGFVADYDFMERGITPSGSSKVLESVLSQNNAGVITIVVITSEVSVLSVGAYFLLRKRKEH